MEQEAYPMEIEQEDRHPEPTGAMVEVSKSRVMQEIQAGMTVAKGCPRDQNAAYSRIMTACKRRSLAEQAMYTYPRGGQNVTGPSIRMAEVLAQNWGNLDFGIVEVEQRPGESVMMSYAWDLETNVRQVKIFTVPHVRWTKKYGATRLRDPRDIYEMTANQGARRLRACILGVIPGDIVEAAVQRCSQTLTEGHTKPLADRIREMAASFSEFGVSAEMIEKRLGHKLSTTTEQELVNLFGVYRAIRDNMQPAHAYFEQDEAEQAKPTADRVRDAVKAKAGGNGGQSAPEPSADDKPKPNGGPKITVKQRNKIMAQFGNLDVPDEIRHAYCANVYGTENLGELSKANASDLIDVLTRCEETDDGDYFAKALAEAEGTEPSGDLEF